jgi:hypothetical protein
VSDALLFCGHPPGNLDRSVETGAVFCRFCYVEERRRDAEQRERELLAERDALLAACKAVAVFADCADAADWKDAWWRLTSQCARAVKQAKGGAA